MKLLPVVLKDAPASTDTHVDAVMGSGRKKRKKRVKDLGVDNTTAVSCAMFRKGDIADHPFHGNQYETGESGSEIAQEDGAHGYVSSWQQGNDVPSAVKDWVSGNPVGIRHAAAHLLGRPVPIDGFKDQDWQGSVTHAQILLGQLNQAPAFNGKLYRGLDIDNRVPIGGSDQVKQFGESMQVGKTIDIPIASFSSSASVASRFGNTRLIVDSPQHALSLGASSIREEDEILTGGRFKVVSITDDYNRPISAADGPQPFKGWNIHLQQIDTFDLNKVKKTLGPGDYQPWAFDFLLDDDPARPPIATPLVKMLPIFFKGEAEHHAFRGNQWTGGIPGPGTPEFEARSQRASDPEHARNSMTPTVAPETYEGRGKNISTLRDNAKKITTSQYEDENSDYYKDPDHSVIEDPRSKVKQDINARLSKALVDQMQSNPKLQAWAAGEVTRMKLDDPQAVGEGPTASKLPKWRAVWLSTVGIDSEATTLNNQKMIGEYGKAAEKWVKDNKLKLRDIDAVQAVRNMTNWYHNNGPIQDGDVQWLGNRLGLMTDKEIQNGVTPTTEIYKRLGKLSPAPVEPKSQDMTVPNVPFPKDVREVAIAARVRRAVDQWAASAGDSNPESITLQIAARDHFGMDDKSTKNLEAYAKQRHMGMIDDDSSPLYGLSNGKTETVPASSLAAGDLVKPIKGFSTVDMVVSSSMYNSQTNTMTLKFGSNLTIEVPSQQPMEYTQRASAFDNAWEAANLLNERDRPFYDNFVGQVYEATQHDLKSKGIDHILVQRGAYWNPNDSTTPEFVRPPVKFYNPTTTDKYLDEIKPGDQISWPTKNAGARADGQKTFATVKSIEIPPKTPKQQEAADAGLTGTTPENTVTGFIFHTDKGAVHVDLHGQMYRTTYEGFPDIHNDRNFDEVAVVDPTSDGEAVVDLHDRDVLADTNPLTSWSSDRREAMKFASDYAEPGDSGVMFHSVVPAERVFSIAASSGPGALNEREVLVIGPKFDAKMEYVKDMWGSPIAGATEGKLTIKNPSVWGIKTNAPPPVSMKTSDLKPGDWFIHPEYGATKVDKINGIGQIQFTHPGVGLDTYEPKNVAGDPTDIVMAIPKALAAGSSLDKETWDKIDAAAAKVVKKAAPRADIHLDDDPYLADWIKHLAPDVDHQGKEIHGKMVKPKLAKFLLPIVLKGDLPGHQFHGNQYIDVGGESIPVIDEEGARGNSRAVSHEEFTSLATEGKQKLDAMRAQSSPPDGLDRNLPMLTAKAYVEAIKPWGGMTIDAHTGEVLNFDGQDKYSLTVKAPGQESVMLDEHPDPLHFAAAMREARSRFATQLSAKGHALGIFHDDSLHRIDFDPVLVVDSPHDVETIGSYTHSVGGAYHYASGNGYWPPHVSEHKKAPALAKAKMSEAQFHGLSRDPNQKPWRPKPIALPLLPVSTEQPVTPPVGKTVSFFLKGDLADHAFRGNQYVAGIDGPPKPLTTPLAHTLPGPFKTRDAGALIAPGTNPADPSLGVSGRGTARPDNFAATTMPGLTPEYQAKVMKQVTSAMNKIHPDQPVTEDTVGEVAKQRLRDLYTQAQKFHEQCQIPGTPEYVGTHKSGKKQQFDPMTEGPRWYDVAHQTCADISKQTGYPLRQIIGSMASLSPNSFWSENAFLTGWIAHTLKDDKPLNISAESLAMANKKASLSRNTMGTDVTIKNGMRLSQMNPLQAAVALKAIGQDQKLTIAGYMNASGKKEVLVAWNTGLVNISKAVSMMRDGVDPSTQVSGHKTRSFFNNIADPDNKGGRGDVTMDSHAVSAAAGAMIANAAPMNDLLFSAGNSDKSQNVKGTYAFFADAYRDVAREVGMTPNQFQAVEWLQWNNISLSLPKNQTQYPSFGTPPRQTGEYAKKPKGKKKVVKMVTLVLTKDLL